VWEKVEMEQLCSEYNRGSGALDFCTPGLLSRTIVEEARSE